MSKIHLDKYKLNISINGSGRKVVYDVIRKKEIPYTPEEDVRQKLIQYIIKELKVPEYMIDEEISMKYYHFDSKRRPDILILRKNNDTGDTSPMVVIECKKRGTIIDDTIIEQTIFYAENLNCEFAVITDGEYIDIIHYIDTDDCFEELNKMPEYNVMTDAHGKSLLQ